MLDKSVYNPPTDPIIRIICRGFVCFVGSYLHCFIVFAVLVSIATSHESFLSSHACADMLAGWLQRVDQVQKDGIPTWRLETGTGGGFERPVHEYRPGRLNSINGMASEIEDKH